MATVDPPPDESSDEPGGRPTLTQHQSSRGNRLASDDPSTPGPDGRFSARHHDVDVEHDASHRSDGRQKNHKNVHIHVGLILGPAISCTGNINSWPR